MPKAPRPAPSPAESGSPSPNVALPEAQWVKVAELQPHPDNYNQHPARQVAELARSLEQFGQPKPLIVWQGKILAGEGLWRAARKLGRERLRAVDVSGVWPEAQALAYLAADNETARMSDPDYEALLALVQRAKEGGVEVPGVDAAYYQELLAVAGEPEPGEPEEDLPPGSAGGAELSARVRDVPDTVWPSDNDFGIPLLDLNLQADALDLPVVLWGSGQGVSLRLTHMRGTWNFYTEDWRFRALWTNPTPVTNSGCVNVFEPNFSVYRDMPRVCALWQIYRKRWLARYWQSFGLRVFVDLNVAPAYAEDNHLGVPAGWRAFCTRGSAGGLASTAQEFAWAKQCAGTGSLLFVVYGGGRAVKAWCQEHGVLWVPEDRDVAEGRPIAAGALEQLSVAQAGQELFSTPEVHRERARPVRRKAQAKHE